MNDFKSALHANIQKTIKRLRADGALPGDSWKILQGQVCKADSAEDEGTTVIIETIC